MSEIKGIFAALAEVNKSISAVSKGRKNEKQGYSFRGIDDVYNEIHDAMAENGIISMPRIISDRTEDRKGSSGTALIYRVLQVEYTFYAPDGSSVSCSTIGEGMDSGDKASNKALSVAHKYALMQMFTIPTSEKKDSEDDSPEIGRQDMPRQPKKQTMPPQTPPPPQKKPAPQDQYAKFLAAVSELRASPDLIKHTLASYNVTTLDAIPADKRREFYNALEKAVQK